MTKTVVHVNVVNTNTQLYKHFLV